ncbi:MAG TPA: polysaccharide deacetylase family protein [Pseudomonadota bacterium]|nr:polysaccharide deacetylase family protein [Pseudomonadota bacterium]
MRRHFTKQIARVDGLKDKSARRRFPGALAVAALSACGSDPVVADTPPPPPPVVMMMPDPPPMEIPLPPIPSKDYSAAHPVGYYPRDPIPDATAYLTIDDGPSEYTLAFLDTLKQKGVKATFFVNAYGLKGSQGLDASYLDPMTMQPVQYRDILKRMVDEGHVIGNHTMHHPDLAKSTPTDLATELDHNQTLVNQALLKAGGRAQPLTLIRPPYGSPFITRLDDSKLTDADRSLLRSVGGPLADRGLSILWNLDSSDSADWAKDEWYTNATPQPPGKASSYTFAEKVERIKKTILTDKLVTTGKGVVILFHDTHPCTRDALGGVIDGLRAAGYSFATIEDLVNSRWQRPSAELTPGPDVFNGRVAVRDWGCQDFSVALGAPARTRAHELCGRAWSYFAQSGGVEAFGRPLAAPEARSGLSGQWLESSRLELRPDLDRPLDVVPAKLGVDRLTQLGIDWRTTTTPAFAEEPGARSGCLLIERAATDGGRGIRHNICDATPSPAGTGEAPTGFLTLWKKLPDPLAALGYPVSAAYFETSSGSYVQWFERARLERAPARPEPRVTELGKLLRMP